MLIIIIVKSQLPLTCHIRRALSIIGFALKGPPKWGFGGNFGSRGKYIWSEPQGMQRPPICLFSDIFGPDLTRRIVAFCMGIAACHRRKFGQVWGSTAPLSKVAGKLRCRNAPLWTFDYHTEKSESFCDVTSGL